MDRTTAEKLMSIYRRLGDLFNEATLVVGGIEDEQEQRKIRRALAEGIAAVVLNLERPIVREYPDLDPNDEMPEPAPPLNAEQLARVDQLSEADIAAIDAALLEDASVQWRKVARVVGSAIARLRARIPDVPDLFYAQRVRHLVAIGRLESQGNLGMMRFSEIRLPRTEAE